MMEELLGSAVYVGAIVFCFALGFTLDGNQWKVIFGLTFGSMLLWALLGLMVVGFIEVFL